MPTLIRNNVFETNSSSCHSLSVVSNGPRIFETLPVDEEGFVNIEPGEFGWDQETYHDAGSKLAYVAQYILEWTDNQRDYKTETVEMTGPNAKRFWSILEGVVNTQTGSTGIRFQKSEGYDPLGYIDHQSVEDRNLDYLFEDCSVLRNLIFNPASYIETDNDNH